MIAFTIPGLGDYRLEHLIMDVNGTLAVDGQLMDGVAEKDSSLRNHLAIHLLTADTHGKQAALDRQLDLIAVRIMTGAEATQKANYVRRPGSDQVVAIGQGGKRCGYAQNCLLRDLCDVGGGSSAGVAPLSRPHRTIDPRCSGSP